MAQWYVNFQMLFMGAEIHSVLFWGQFYDMCEERQKYSGQ